MNKLIGAGVLAAALGVSSQALAGDQYQEMRPYFSGLYSHVFEEDDRDDLVGGTPETISKGKGVQLGVGKAINRWLGIELSAFAHNYTGRTAGGPDMEDYGAKLDALFFYSRNPSFSPYFGIGAGGIRTGIKSQNNVSTDPFADVGIGMMKFFELWGQEMGFRTDLRYRQIFFGNDAFGGVSQDDVGEAVLNVGFVVPLGPKPYIAPAAPAPAACADSDGDGVCDSADLCPETPKGVAVDSKGCPTDKAAKGDPNQKFEDVHFAFDKSELSDYARSLLDNAASVIEELSKQYPSLKVNISGHTDWVGTDGYNQGLSEQRAVVVKQYLLRKGVDGARISTQAYGETRPKATNANAEGRALNRRAEVRTSEK